MQPMATIRKWQIEQLDKMMSTLQYLISTTTQEAAHTYRDGGDGWTVLEVMGHLREFEAVFLQRAQLTLNEDNPALPFPNPNELVTAKQHNNDDLQESYNTWAATRRELVALLEKANADETAWERPAQHPTRGNFTLTDQLILTVWHDTNHLEQIAHILRDKHSG